MRVVSIDTETTGLDPLKHRVIEVGAVIFDTEGTERVHGNWLIKNPDHEYMPMSPYCAKLHTENGLWDRFSGKNGDIIGSVTFAMEFSKWLSINNLKNPITVAGKNFGSFDLQFLKQLPDWSTYIKIRHRTIDPAILFMYPDDAALPSLDECCERAGIERRTDHTALADAILVADLTVKGLQCLPVAL
jgi:DNA polymerase III epsilon subunit-like protein